MYTFRMRIATKIAIALSILLSISIGTSANESTAPKVKIGGALRYNYNLSSWKQGQQKRGGDFGYDLFRINAKASYQQLKINAEYRWYAKGYGGGMLKQGWIGYDLTPKDNLQIGLTQVPFGNTTYNSHSWFFSIDYYTGMEDDHDMGIKYTHKGEKWDYAIAFFKNAEEMTFGSNTDISNSRYAYDVGSIEIEGKPNIRLRNKETNQINGQINYKFGSNAQHNIGTSLQYGGLYNLDTEQTGHRYAIALHYRLLHKNVSLKAQISNYKHNAKNPTGQPSNMIAMTAFNAPYLIAASATNYTLGIAYTIPINGEVLSSIQLYNDFGYMDKTDTNFEDTMMNVTGMLLTAGNIYTYIDYALGKNQPWLGDVWTNALSKGTPNAKWHSRFNINIGYYF